jgi:hypothetical protein
MGDPLDVEAGIETNLALGYMEHVGYDADGTPLYRVTEAGAQHIESMLADGNTEDQS